MNNVIIKISQKKCSLDLKANIPYNNTVAIKRNATTHFLTLKAYNSLTTYARTIILYLF